MTDEKKVRSERACDTARQFMELFYDRLDHKRHTIGKLYLDSATLAWNGNKVMGSHAIQQFLLDKLPPTSHEIISLDAHPVLDAAVQGQTTVLVCTAGTVRFRDRRSRPFQQSFLITAQGDKWKVASDTFRHQEHSAASSSSSLTSA